MKYYLAYGSNLSKMQMAFRCPDAVPIGATKLKNWELVFRRGFLTIEPKMGAAVPLGIWKISDEDEKNLDRYEGFPRFYQKEHLLFVNAEKEVSSALIYIMNDGFPVEEPSLAYMRTCTRGYKDFGMDTAPLMKAYRKAKGEKQ